MDCHRDRGSRCSRLGYGINLLEEVAFNPTTELRGLTQELKKTLGGLKQYLVHQEKGAVTPQETDPDLPVSVRESPAEVWISGGLLQGWGH